MIQEEEYAAGNATGSVELRGCLFNLYELVEDVLALFQTAFYLDPLKPDRSEDRKSVV